MPRVDVLAEASLRDPEVVLIERLPSDISADEHNADQLAERTRGALEDAEPPEQAVHVHDGGSAAVAPARSDGARLQSLQPARCAVRLLDARATGAQPPAAARTTARRASSPSSSSTQAAPLVTSLKA